jgi:hypothetical protein
MNDSYDNLARALAGISQSPRACPPLPHVMRNSGLTRQVLTETVTELVQRGWATLSVNGTVVELTSAGKDRVGEEAQELLAFDIAEWVRNASHEQFAVADLPEHLRGDRQLLELALEVLEGFGAARLVSGRRGTHEVLVDPGMRMFGRTVDTPRLRPLVQIHNGDVIGRDKNTVHGSGTIVAGSGNTVSQHFDLSASLSDLIAELRTSGQFSEKALGLLEGATVSGASPMAVAAATEKAIASEPRLRDKLRAWLSDVTSSAAGSLLFEAVKFGVVASLGQ